MPKTRTFTIVAALAALAGAAQAQPGEVIPFPKAPSEPPPAAAPAPAPGGPAVPGARLPGCAPAKLTRIVVRNISPNLMAAAPAAQPRTIFRQGSTLFRNEESPDPTRNVHGIVIIAEPDVWSLNMATRTGQHQVDPGPDLTVRAPVLPVGQGLPPQFGVLEFGCEPDFVAQYAPQPRQIVSWGTARATLHVAAVGEHSVSILMHDGRRAPLMAVYAKAGTPVFAMRYDEWRSDLPDRPALFELPKGVKVTDAPAARPLPQKPST